MSVAFVSQKEGHESLPEKIGGEYYYCAKVSIFFRIGLMVY